MKIRKEQMDSFSLNLEEAFVKHMVQHLLDDFPKQLKAQHIKHKHLDPLVRRGMAEAEKYGITSEAGIQQYLECMIVLGPEFDRDERYPWAGEILRNSDLNPSQKTEAIAWHMLSEVDWEETSYG